MEFKTLDELLQSVCIECGQLKAFAFELAKLTVQIGLREKIVQCNAPYAPIVSDGYATFFMINRYRRKSFAAELIGDSRIQYTLYTVNIFSTVFWKTSKLSNYWKFILNQYTFCRTLLAERRCLTSLIAELNLNFSD